LHFEADYQPEDVIRTFQAAMDDPGCPPVVALLLDVRRSSSLGGRTSDEIRHVAEYVGPYRERLGGRLAILSGSELHYGMGRIGSVYSGGVGIDAKVFRDEESALLWLSGESKVSTVPRT
jgi:hypothetical protein